MSHEDTPAYETEEQKLRNKLKEYQDAYEEAQLIFKSMSEEIATLKKENTELHKKREAALDPTLERFVYFHGLSYEPPSNLVDLLTTKGEIERAAFLKELEGINRKMNTRLDELSEVQNKLFIAEQLVR